MGVEGREQFLLQADNVVASYILRGIQCENSQFRQQCEDMDCVWVENTGCYVRHEEVREFFDVDCMDPVRHLVDSLAGNHECLPIDTEVECSSLDRCYWTDGACAFDRWKFYHGIPTVDAFPETFGEVLAARNLQLTNDIQDATENGDVETYADLPNWDPPAFNCPVIYEEVICNYVDALTPFLVISLYCNTQYQSATDIIDCNNDELCEADTNDPTNICGPSTDAVVPAFRDAAIVFAESIEDPEARTYEVKRTECAYIEEEDDCDEDCIWENGACALSEKWQEEEVYRLVGDTDDPVCEYYVLPAKSGCYDRERESVCTEDNTCFYRTETDECVINFNEVVAYSLEISGVLEAYEATTEECEEQEDEDDCESVEPTEVETSGRGGTSGGGRGGTRANSGTNVEGEEADPPITIDTLSTDPDSPSDADGSVVGEDEDVEAIEGSLPPSIEPEEAAEGSLPEILELDLDDEASLLPTFEPEEEAEPSVEAIEPSTSSAVDDEIGRVQGLGGILGFGRR